MKNKLKRMLLTLWALVWLPYLFARITFAITAMGLTDRYYDDDEILRLPDWSDDVAQAIARI